MCSIRAAVRRRSMGKRKKHDEPVSLPNAHLSGREYAEDRPDNCRDCFFWKKSTDSCTRYECFFLRPLRKKIEERFDENGKLILDCRICPYNRVSLLPCSWNAETRLPTLRRNSISPPIFWLTAWGIRSMRYPNTLLTGRKPIGWQGSVTDTQRQFLPLNAGQKLCGRLSFMT